MINKNIFLFCLLLFISCKKQENIHYDYSEQEEVSEKFNLFLESPLLLNNELNNSLLKKTYITSDSKHFNRLEYFNLKELDTLLRYTSNTKDTIDVFKNHYTNKIIKLSLSNNLIKLNSGLFIGMKFEDFDSIFHIERPNKYNSIINYEDEFYKASFVFKKNVLVKILYERYLD